MECPGERALPSLRWIEAPAVVRDRIPPREEGGLRRSRATLLSFASLLLYGFFEWDDLPIIRWRILRLNLLDIKLTISNSKTSATPKASIHIGHATLFHG